MHYLSSVFLKSLVSRHVRKGKVLVGWYLGVVVQQRDPRRRFRIRLRLRLAGEQGLVCSDVLRGLVSFQFLPEQIFRGDGMGCRCGSIRYGSDADASSVLGNRDWYSRGIGGRNGVTWVGYFVSLRLFGRVRIGIYPNLFADDVHVYLLECSSKGQMQKYV